MMFKEISVHKLFSIAAWRQWLRKGDTVVSHVSALGTNGFESSHD